MSQEDSKTRMSFFEHLDELRARLMKSLWVFVIGFGLCYLIRNELLEFLRAPLFDAMPEGQRKLYFTNLFEGFFVHLKISGYASLFFFSPYFFYQFWQFIAPGLYPRERKMVIPFVAAATVCFLGGAAFAYYGLFPVGFKYFMTYGGESEVPWLTMDAYYSLVLKLMLLFGAAFELPVVICLLGYFGIVDSETLKKHRKTAALAITVVSAFIAPPDAVSMLMLMAPLILLYEASIWVVALFGKQQKKSEVVLSENKKREKEAENPLSGKSE